MQVFGICSFWKITQHVWIKELKPKWYWCKTDVVPCIRWAVYSIWCVAENEECYTCLVKPVTKSYGTAKIQEGGWTSRVQICVQRCLNFSNEILKNQLWFKYGASQRVCSWVVSILTSIKKVIINLMTWQQSTTESAAYKLTTAVRFSVVCVLLPQ